MLDFILWTLLSSIYMRACTKFLHEEILIWSMNYLNIVYTHTHIQRNYRLFRYTRIKNKKNVQLNARTFCIYRIFASLRTLRAWTPLRNSACFKIALRCIPRFVRYFPVDRRPSKRCMRARTHRRAVSLTRFPRNNKRGGTLFAIKRIQLPLYFSPRIARWNSYL